jgi:thioredoxin reductase (NADPH)
VGGGPAGLTTSIYAARENLETLIIDSKGLGGQAGVTERLDNYPGFPEGVGGADLADRIVRQAQRYGVEMLQALSVTSIEDIGGEEVRVVTSTGDHYEARAVLIATGSSYRRTGAMGEEDLIGAGIHFCATCDGPFYKGSEELLVLGGGNSGLEEGLFLAQFTDKVTVVEYKDRLAGSQLLQDKVAADPKMNVLLNRKVTSFSPKDDGSGKIGTVVLENVQTGETEEHHPAGVFVFVGLDPNTGFLDGTVDLDERGFVVTDDTFMTSLPGVFAAGDVRVGSTKQLASAVGEGAAVAIQIRGYLDRQLDEAVHTGV